MITLQRSAERFRTTSGGRETWKSFNTDSAFDPGRNGFRTLECFREESLAPGAVFESRAPRNLEVLTYVWRGTLLLESPGGAGVSLETGECHRSAARTGALLRGTNGSKTDATRLFQGFLTPDRGILQTPAEKRFFPLAERRGMLRLLVSRTGRDASLRMRQDAGMYSSVLDRGQHLIHEMVTGRGAWLHVVSGRIQLIDQLLEAGDGASLVEEPAVSLTAREPAEILLFDLL
jgi:redox-sensitive bicupin YhaK (pirin superfamily)